MRPTLDQLLEWFDAVKIRKQVDVINPRLVTFAGKLAMISDGKKSTKKSRHEKDNRFQPRIITIGKSRDDSVIIVPDVLVNGEKFYRPVPVIQKLKDAFLVGDYGANLLNTPKELSEEQVIAWHTVCELIRFPVIIERHYKGIWKYAQSYGMAPQDHASKDEMICYLVRKAIMLGVETGRLSWTMQRLCQNSKAIAENLVAYWL
ncbi:MAG: hypothetical protein QXP01_01230 [Candidatus Hadarchaeum sp.]